MRSNTGKHPRATFVILASCFGLLAAALILDFFWASSSSSSTTTIASVATYTNAATNWDLEEPIWSESLLKKAAAEYKKFDHLITTNTTFGDLPGPELQWEEMEEAPVPRLDGAAIQIDDLFYVFAGFGTLDHVHSHVDVYNFKENKWTEKFEMPKEMANSHLGMATDGRYIYAITGQYGAQCSTPTARTFVLDTKTRKWSDLPMLPAPRYAPATQLWRGRLHVMGGGKEDRHEPSVEHWSIAVKDGKALEEEWRTEIPIPRGGPHRACMVVDDRLYIIGGQEGDFMAKPGSPNFKCSRRKETQYADVYMLEAGKEWKELPSMPKPNSHIEFSWVVVNNSIIIVGGATLKHPVTKRLILVGEVFRFNLDTLEWSVIGRMPCRDKTTLAAYWNGWLYFTSGQRDRGPDNAMPGAVIGNTWRTKLQL